MRKSIIAMVGMALAALVSCEKNEVDVAVTSVQVTPATVGMVEGEKASLKATVLPEDATDKTVRWTSSNPGVATVSESGEVTAVAEGSATVTATAGKVSGSCQVTVSRKFVAVTSIALDQEAVTLEKGAAITLKATVKPDDATDPAVSWSSSAPEVVSVEDGVVTAVGGGSAVVTASAGQMTATCAFTVTVPVKSVSLNLNRHTLKEDESVALTATVLPEDATDKTVTWSSSAPEVASVDDAGHVTALTAGSAVITATAGEQSDTCEITVEKKYISVTSITLDQESLALVKGEKATLKATVLPADATNPSVDWSSSAPEVVSVEGGVVTALAAGNAVITAAAGAYTAACLVEVTVPAESVVLDRQHLDMTKGQTVTLKATVLPEDTTDKDLTWASAVPAVASVSADGTVTALKAGETEITVHVGNLSASCTVSVTVPVEEVKLDLTTLAMEIGQEVILGATVLPEDATDPSLSWKSSKPSVASVSEDGLVKALAVGSAVVTVSAGGKEATCQVTVHEQIVPVESITLSKTEVTVAKGRTVTLSATVKPTNATDKTVTWRSSDDTIATVDDKGKVTGVKGGKAVVTARAGEVEATCSVEVTAEVESVTLSEKNLSVPEGGTAQLTATVNPDDATDKTLTWSSSNKSIATVDENGLVTGIKGGSTVITVKAGKKSATCSVTVTVPVQSVTLDKTTASVDEGATLHLSATVYPSYASDKTVTWTSSDESVATVDASGVVSGVRRGTAVITAKAGDCTATCQLTVTVPVTSVTLDQTSLNMDKGATAQLNVTVKPDDATDRTVIWSSSDPSIVSVDALGKLKALKGGVASITAQAGNCSASCTVSVFAPVEGVSLSQTSAKLVKDKSLTLVATVLPEDATDKSVSWSNSAPGIASVDASGKVTGVSVGKAIITADASGFTATCEINVYIPVSSVTLDQTSYTLHKGKSFTLTATVNPSDATDKTVTWESSDSAIATVDANGKVTGVATGEVTITAKAGDCKATCRVTVIVPVTSITLNKTEASVEETKTVQLKATVKPDEATDKTVTWVSSDDTIAKVDADGLVKGIQPGEAVITAKAGDCTATCKVTVTEKNSNTEDFGDHDGEW